MGKRSSFERIPRDAYDTPVEAVLPLLPHLPESFRYWEPCAGALALVGPIGRTCVCTDIEPRDALVSQRDALETDLCEMLFPIDFIITNPPWSRKVLHPMIEHFSDMRPTWLLFDADWVHTRQSAPFLPRLRKIVSVGRVKWIPGSKMTGKDNCCWYLFDRPSDQPAQFFGRAQ